MDRYQLGSACLISIYSIIQHVLCILAVFEVLSWVHEDIEMHRAPPEDSPHGKANRLLNGWS